MIRHFLTVATLGLVACGGGGDDDVTPDAPISAPQTIMISGAAQEISAGGADPSEGVLIEAFSNTDEATVITTATTNASGNYTLIVETDGSALDGFLKATKSGLLVTYLYPPEPLAADFDGASINMVSQQTFNFLSSVLCSATQDSSKGTIAALVYDASDVPVAGATISTSPAASSVCYNGTNDLPDGDATATAADGVGYLFNVTGDVTISATASPMPRSHSVKARAGALTTTLLRP